MKLNSEFRREAIAALRGQWWLAALCTLICGVPSFISMYNQNVGTLLGLLLVPLSFGMALVFLRLYRGTAIAIPTLFEGFKDYVRVFCTLLLTNLYVFLWTLLLIVPGIIKFYSYSMVPFILADEPELKNNGAIEKSMRMMNGHKMRLFMLDLSFIGWFLLSIITCGIGLLFLLPYMYTAHAAFYEDLKAEQTMQNV